MKKAFGSDEAVKFIKNNIDKTEMLKEKTEYLNRVIKEKMQVTQKMAQLSNRDRVTQIARMNAENMLLSIGNALFPIYSAILEVFSSLARNVSRFFTTFKTGFPIIDDFFSKFNSDFNLIDRISNFIRENKTLFKWIMLVVGAISAFVVVVKGVGFVVNLVVYTLSSLHTVLKLVKIQTYKNIAARASLAVWSGILAVKTGLVTAATWLFSAALWANPIVIVIVGIVALIAAIVALIYYWKDIVKWVQKTWKWFVKFVTESKILKKIGQMIDKYIIANIKKIIDVGKKMWNKLSGWFDKIKTMIGSISLSNIFSWGTSKFSYIINKIKGFVNKLYHLIVNSKTFKSIRNFIYRYLIQPFERIQALIDSVSKKIKNNILFKKISEYITGSIDVGKEGLSNSNKTEVHVYNENNIQNDKDGDTSIQNKSVIRKFNPKAT